MVLVAFIFLRQIFQPSAGKFMSDKSSNLFKIQNYQPNQEKNSGEKGKNSNLLNAKNFIGVDFYANFY